MAGTSPGHDEDGDGGVERAALDPPVAPGGDGLGLESKEGYTRTPLGAV